MLVIFSLQLKHVANVAERQLPLKTKLKRVDPIGIVLLFGFVSCLCIALQDGGNNIPWSSSRVIGLLVGFGVLKILFWIAQWRLGEHALIPVRFLRQRTVAFGSLFLFCDNMSNYIVSVTMQSPQLISWIALTIVCLTETLLPSFLFPIRFRHIGHPQRSELYCVGRPSILWFIAVRRSGHQLRVLCRLFLWGFYED